MLQNFPLIKSYYYTQINTWSTLIFYRSLKTKIVKKNLPPPPRKKSVKSLLGEDLFFVYYPIPALYLRRRRVRSVGAMISLASGAGPGATGPTGAPGVGASHLITTSTV